ncbi:MAG: permease [Chitinivibrionales bacterium]|nr:permease [Chitinivibrionales bacterium]
MAWSWLRVFCVERELLMSKTKAESLPFFTIRDLLLAAVVLSVSLFLFFPTPLGIARHVFAITWSSIFLEALCFMLIGSVVSGVVEEFVPRGLIERLVQSNRIAVVTGAAAMGFIFPVCECAIVPVVRRLLKKGVPLSAGIAFMLAAPIVNPVVIWSTAVAYQGQWFMAITRVLFGYGTACMAAIFVGTLFSADKALLAGIPETAGHCGCGYEHGHDDGPGGSHSHEAAHCSCSEHGCSPLHSAHHKNSRLWNRAISSLRHARDDFFDVAPYLVIGTLVAAIIRSSIPASAIEQLADRPLLSIGGMMAFAFALNLCSEADAFIAASFAGIVPLAGQMAFMVLGPMLDIKLLLMYRSVFRGKFIVVLSSVVILLVLAYMLLFGYMIGRAAL